MRRVNEAFREIVGQFFFCFFFKCSWCIKEGTLGGERETSSLAPEFSRFDWVLVIKFSLYMLRRLRWSFLLINASGYIKIHQEATVT